MPEELRVGSDFGDVKLHVAFAIGLSICLPGAEEACLPGVCGLDVEQPEALHLEAGLWRPPVACRRASRQRLVRALGRVRQQDEGRLEEHRRVGPKLVVVCLCLSPR